MNTWREALPGVVVVAGEGSVLDLALAPEAIRLSAVTVTPSRFAIMGREPQARQTLTEAQIQTIPHFGEDVYRAVPRLPGISSSDFSAKFTVRDGERDEVLVLFDGVQLYEPFHLKGIDGGVLSSVDVQVIEGIDLLTGGYPAECGDRTSGSSAFARGRFSWWASYAWARVREHVGRVESQHGTLSLERSLPGLPPPRPAPQSALRYPPRRGLGLSRAGQRVQPRQHSDLQLLVAGRRRQRLLPEEGPRPLVPTASLHRRQLELGRLICLPSSVAPWRRRVRPAPQPSQRRRTR